MPQRPADTLQRLCRHVRETALLDTIQSLLNWDERTMMPPAAGPYRAEQVTMLAGIIHRRETDPRVGEWLDELNGAAYFGDAHSDEATIVRQVRRDYERKRKLPQSLVEELARASVLGQQAWVEARANDDFASFRPHVEKIFGLKRQMAEALGYPDCPYDALLENFEPGAKTAEVTEVLAALRAQLIPLVRAIMESGRRPRVEILQRHYRVVVQEAFGRDVAARVGFEFERGRLDVTHHPFCTFLGPHDCRITTRYENEYFPSAFFGILHEAGHGIYDQGLRPDQFGLPPGMFASLGIHESQSRMWENLVGRSRAFWKYFFPQAQEAFPEALGDVSLDEFYFAVNDVRPSLIRVEADEATYNLHIVIRFELEQALVHDELPVVDLPAAWNEKYREYLGIEPPNDASGVLQDIHWSGALVGYFPTYSLGNLYASQFFEQADADLDGLDNQFARGGFAPLREWLRENIHRHGQCFTAGELVERVTGKPLSHEPLMRHLRGKLGSLYGIA
jgi:carboxypeptidase Taq